MGSGADHTTGAGWGKRGRGAAAGRCGIGQQGSLRLALEGAAARFESDANKLEASLTTYRQTDEISIPKPQNLNLGTQQ